MRVWVDAARHDLAAASIDSIRRGRNFKTFAHRGNLAVLATNIGAKRLFRCNHRAAPNMPCHIVYPRSPMT